MDSSHLLVIAQDSAGRACYANRAVTQTLGLALADLQTPAGLQAVLPQIGSSPAATDGAGEPIEVPLRTRAGEECIIAWQAEKISADGGGTLWLGQDVTARKRDHGNHVQAKTARRESELRFRALFDLHPDGVLVVDAATRQILLANDRMCRLLGGTAAEIVQLGVADIHPPESLPEVAAQFARLARQEVNLAPDIPMRRRDGSVFLADISSSHCPIDGRPAVLGLFRDATPRRQADAEARRQAESLRLALEAAGMVTWEWDIPTGTIRYSDNLATLLGSTNLSPYETLTALNAQVHPDDRPRLAQALESTHQIGAAFECDYRIRGADGYWRWFLGKSGRVEMAGDKPMRVSGVSIEITGRKQIDTALARREELLSAIFSQAMNAITRIDGQTGRFIEFNTAAHEGLGYSRAQFAILTVGDIQAEHTPERIRKIFEQIRQGGSMSFETRHRHRDGSLRDVYVSARTLRLQSQDYLVAVWEDITERKRTQAVLQQSLMFRREAEKIGRIGAWMANPRTDHLYWTEGVNEILEAPLDFQPGLAEGLKFYDADALPILQDALQRALSDGTPFVVEVGLTTMTGKHLWTEVRGLGRLEAGSDAFVMGTFQDVTDRRQAKEALRESEERYRTIVETSFDWIWEIDIQGRYTYASPRVQELLGYAPEEVIGRTPFDFMPKAEAQRVQLLFQRVVEARQPVVALENICQHRDGRRVFVETSGVPIFGADGAWRGYRGMDRDITARRAAERTLRLHGAALEAAANAIVITDRTGTIEWANPAFTTLSGWTFAEARGRSLRELVEPDDRDFELHQKQWAAVAAGQVWRGEIVSRRKDGMLRTEDVTITPLRDEHGEITHGIAIKQDITEQKKLEAQFLQSQRMEAIGTLAGGIAHDLNNILSPMLMICGVLKDKLADEEDQELILMLQREARRGADIIKQLLTFSRGLSGERSLVQPRHLLKEMAAMMRETFPREIDLRSQLSGQLWTVVADPTQLHQVVMNLCVNARDAMPDGGHLSLRASNVTLPGSETNLPPTAVAGPYVRIAVSDTGHGIPSEIRHRIFDPFFTTKALGKGTGLGLSTVLGIVQNHGGFVTVDSEPDRGTTFVVYLPAAAGQESVPPVAAAAPAAIGKGETILVVDDERNLRETIRVLLETSGYRVLLATNGDDALSRYFDHRNDVALVLTDLMMPVMNGVALIRALRALDPDLPIIASSGLGEISHRGELTSLGVPEILMKPCEAPQLLAAIRSRLVRPAEPPSAV